MQSAGTVCFFLNHFVIAPENRRGDSEMRKRAGPTEIRAPNIGAQLDRIDEICWQWHAEIRSFKYFLKSLSELPREAETSVTEA